MKHPALTRVFSVVLAVMAVIMAVAGGVGIGKAFSSRSEDSHTYDLLSSRIEKYETLRDYTSEHDTSATLQAQYDEKLARHNSSTDAYRTELSTYTIIKAYISQANSAMSAYTSMSGTDVLNMLSNSSSTESLLDMNAVMDGVIQPGDTAELERSTAAAEALIAASSNYATASSEYDTANDAYETAKTAAEAEGATDEDRQALAEAEAKKNEAEQKKKTAETAMNAAEATAATAAADAPGNYEAIFNNAVMVAENNIETQLRPKINDAVNSLMELVSGVSQLDEMEKQNLERGMNLAVTKSKLQDEQDELDSLKAELDEVKSAEKQLVSLRINMSSMADSIKQAADNGKNVLTAANSELQRFGKSYKVSFVFRLLMNVLAIAGAVAAFLGIPAAFEIKNTRAWLVVPVIVFTSCAVLAEVISVALGRGQNYPCLIGAVFGAIQLALVARAPATKLGVMS